MGGRIVEEDGSGKEGPVLNGMGMKDGYPGARRLLNLGCGPEAVRSDWEDYDGSWNLMLRRSIAGRLFTPLIDRYASHGWPGHVRFLSLTGKLPFREGTIDGIYASHVLEHLHHADALRFLRECLRILKTGGILRLVLPDLEHLAKTYLRSADADAAMQFNQALLFRPLEAPSSPLHRLQLALADFHSHKFMYDQKLLAGILRETGFRQVERKECHDSAIPEVPQVENPGRILHGAGFALECVK